MDKAPAVFELGIAGGGEQAALISAILDNVPDTLLLFSRRQDGEWGISACNRTAAEMFGMPTDQLIGMTLDDIFGVGAFSRNNSPLPEICCMTGATIEEESYLAVHRDDFWLEFDWWHIKLVPIFSSVGVVEQIAGICQMVTESRQMRDSLKQFTSAISQAGSIIAIVELDGTIDFINPAFESMRGVSSETARGHSIFQFWEPPDAAQLFLPMKTAMHRMEPWQGELPGTKDDGTRYWEYVRMSPILGDDGVAVRYLIIKEDITERRQIEKQLKLASRVLETTDAGVIVTTPAGIIESVNPAFSKIAGYTVEEVVGKSPRILKGGGHDESFYRAMWNRLLSEGHWTGEFVNRKKDGKTFVSSMSISALHEPDGGISHYVGVFSDVTALKDSQRQLESMANFDALTGLPNRRHIHERLDQAISRAAREKQSIALMCFDLDHFKAVNDTLGHPAGDALLKEVSRRMLDQLRQEDTLARLGGDEFIALLEGIAQPERISVVAERIIADLRRAFHIQGGDVFIGCSIGVAYYPKDAKDAETLLRYADLALYRAKDDGRNCYRLYSDEMNARAHHRYRMEAQLRGAIDACEFSVVYQPQFSIDGRRLIGAEALLRWRNPETQSEISPACFIPVAEQIGLIVPISLWVLEQICITQRRILDAALTPAAIAINISPVHFRHENMVTSFMDILNAYGISPRLVEIEITEGAIMDDQERAIQILDDMRRHGFSIAIDDFGTGYSSLGTLKRLPIDKLKIDRSFVRELGSEQGDEVIISAIVAMSRHLGLTTLAEGVETEKQFEYLEFVGCDEIQGYLLGRPMPDAELMKMIRKSA